MKEEIKLQKLNDKQKEIVNAWEDESIKVISVCCGRQVGKTTTALQIAIKMLVQPLYKEKNVKIGFFLPTNKQAKMVFTRVLNLLSGKKGFKFNTTHLKISYNSERDGKKVTGIIDFWTSDNDNCRGYTYDYLFVDEACFVKGEIWFEAIRPTIKVASTSERGKILLTSTPKEKNWFYDYFNNKDVGFKSIKFTSYESVWGDATYESVKAEIDSQRKIMPEPIFRSEYMAEFVDGMQSLFKTADLTFSNNTKDKLASVAGIDWGIDNDYTVLVMLNTNKEVIYINRWRRMLWNDLIQEVIKALRQYGNPLVYAEKNGIGNMPTDELKRLYGAVRPVNTTAQLKTDMILKLAKDLMEEGVGHNKKLILPDVDYVKDEFANYGISYINGMPKFGNINNKTNDDTVMATAIANYNFKSSDLSFI